MKNEKTYWQLKREIKRQERLLDIYEAMSSKHALSEDQLTGYKDALNLYVKLKAEQHDRFEIFMKKLRLDDVFEISRPTARVNYFFTVIKLDEKDNKSN